MGLTEGARSQLGKGGKDSPAAWLPGFTPRLPSSHTCRPMAEPVQPHPLRRGTHDPPVEGEARGVSVCEVPVHVHSSEHVGAWQGPTVTKTESPRFGGPVPPHGCHGWVGELRPEGSSTFLFHFIPRRGRRVCTRFSNALTDEDKLAVNSVREGRQGPQQSTGSRAACADQCPVDGSDSAQPSRRCRGCSASMRTAAQTRQWGPRRARSFTQVTPRSVTGRDCLWQRDSSHQHCSGGLHQPLVLGTLCSAFQLRTHTRKASRPQGPRPPKVQTQT